MQEAVFIIIPSPSFVGSRVMEGSTRRGIEGSACRYNVNDIPDTVGMVYV